MMREIKRYMDGGIRMEGGRGEGRDGGREGEEKLLIRRLDWKDWED